MTYYDILELTPAASEEAIKGAYRSLAKRHHPDRNEQSASSKEIFQQIAEAYAVLSDPVKRAAYDLLLIQRSKAFVPAPRRPTPKEFRQAYQAYRRAAYTQYNWRQQGVGFFWAAVIIFLVGIGGVQLLRYASSVHYEEGMALYRAQQPLAAIHPLELALREFGSHNKESCAALAQISYYHLKNETQALRYCARGLDESGLRETNGLLFFIAARVRTGLGQYETAASELYFARHFGYSPDSCFYYLGELHLYGTRDYTLANLYFDSLLLVSPSSVDAHYGKALALIELGQYHEVINHLDGFLAQRPFEGMAHYLKGKAWLEQGDLSLGCLAIKKALLFKVPFAQYKWEECCLEFAD